MPWKINLWHCPDTSTVSKWSTSIVKFGSTLPKDMLWNVQEQTLTIFGLRRSVFRTKNQRGGSFSCLNALKNKSLTLPGHFDRFKMVHVDSQIKSKMSEVQPYQKTLLWNVQEQTFWQGKPFKSRSFWSSNQRFCQ